MNRDLVEGNWKQYCGKLKEEWGKLLHSDFGVDAGKRDQLAGSIQVRHGNSKQEAEPDKGVSVSQSRPEPFQALYSTVNTQSSLRRITVNSSAKNVLWHFALLLLAALALSSNFARAQQPLSAVAAPRIDGFDVEPAPRLSAGNDLVFTLYGSAGGTAAVQINGVVSAFPLEEVAAGVYAGTYTIKGRDRFTAVATVTANLRVANRIATRITTEVLDQSLLVSVATHSWTRHEANAIALAAVRRTDRIEPGR